MKNLIRLFILLFFITSIYQCKSEGDSQPTETSNTFTMSVDLKGLDEDYLIYWEKDNKYPNGLRVDTLRVTNGKFTFTDSLTGYKIYYLAVTKPRSWTTVYNGKEYSSSTKADVNRLWFIGYPGATITCTGEVKDYSVEAQLSDEKGVNNDLSKIHLQTFPLIDKAHALSVRTYKEKLNESVLGQLRDSIQALRKKAIELKKEFISNNPKSIAATYIFRDAYYRKYFDHKEAKQLFNSLDSEILAGTSFYDEIKNRLEAVERTMIGMQAPELSTKNTYDGSDFDLSSLKGNYVLLDYWGLWCGPCMAEIPKIKEYADKYSEKNFVVVGINSGDATSKWKKAIEDRDYSWTHVQTTNENDLLIPFNVNSFPTKILIDPEGKIIYSSKNQEKVDMYQMIDNIFSKS
ncbi:TlpA disulfide reductase family protein [Gaetbulibacter sp. M240]|uniref:redoxin family protein n=1 Tax=Gaetbulibacter sp. M240 TaxID=3126511 RepID=UPI00374F14E0